MAADGDLGGALAKLASRTSRTAYCTAGDQGMFVARPEEQPRLISGYPVTGPIDIVGAGDSATSGIVTGAIIRCRRIRSRRVRQPHRLDHDPATRDDRDGNARASPRAVCMNSRDRRAAFACATLGLTLQLRLFPNLQQLALRRSVFVLGLRADDGDVERAVGRKGQRRRLIEAGDLDRLTSLPLWSMRNRPPSSGFIQAKSVTYNLPAWVNRPRP